MIRILLVIWLTTLLSPPGVAQDSTVNFEKKIVTLKEVVVRSNLNVPAFIQRVRDDTTFYKAFRNLKVLGYTSINDVRMLNKRGQPEASLNSRTQQEVGNGCRWTKILEETSSGDIYKENHELNYYTAELYAGLFFAMDTICGETNIVKGNGFSMKGKTGIEKHKEQLKMLFFNPGKKIPGIPFIGNKIALFDDEVAARYDFVIDMQAFKGQMCYIFKMTPRQNLDQQERNQVVISLITT